MKPIECAVNPYRFSDDPPAMVDILEERGMRKAVTTSGDWFGLLRAGAGWVGVHRASTEPGGSPAGQTQFVLLAGDARSAADLLEELGVPATVWDESYGRHAGVVDPAGGGVWINEHQADLYGYIGHDGEADPGLSVTMVRASADREADRAFFARFGFVPEPGGNEWWQALRASEYSGVIGLHKPMPGEVTHAAPPAPFAARTSTVRLGFQTSENLEALAERLDRPGYPARVVSGRVTAVYVGLRNGCELEIYPPSAWRGDALPSRRPGVGKVALPQCPALGGRPKPQRSTRAPPPPASLRTTALVT